MDFIRSALNLPPQGTAQAATPGLPGSFPSAEASGPPSRLVAVGSQVNQWIIKPVSFASIVLLSALGKFLSIIYFVETPHGGTSPSDTTAHNALINDPIRRVEQFVRGLEENLSPSHHLDQYNMGTPVDVLPPFFHGSYTQALYMASEKAKFLFVYLTNPATEGSQSLFEKVVVNPKFTSIFKENDQTLIWGGDLTNPEAYQLANNLNITKFPMLGLLCLTRTTTMTPEGPRKSSPRISMVSKIQGGINESSDAEALIQKKFIKRMVKFEPDLALIRADLRERFLAQALRAQQDHTYHESLQRDQQKKAQKLKKSMEEKYLKWRQPYFKQVVGGGASADTSRIAIKFQSGERVTINLPKESPVDDLFLFVELHERGMLGDTYESTMSEEQAAEMFGGLQFETRYRLTSSIPPRPSLNDVERSKKIEEVPFIYPSGLLMVESL